MTLTVHQIIRHPFSGGVSNGNHFHMLWYAVNFRQAQE
jgi:hypothetical protein